MQKISNLYIIKRRKFHILTIPDLSGGWLPSGADWAGLEVGKSRPGPKEARILYRNQRFQYNIRCNHKYCLYNVISSSTRSLAVMSLKSGGGGYQCISRPGPNPPPSPPLVTLNVAILTQSIHPVETANKPSLKLQPLVSRSLLKILQFKLSKKMP